LITILIHLGYAVLFMFEYTNKYKIALVRYFCSCCLELDPIIIIIVIINNNAVISMVQNKLSAVALTAVQTNMSLVFRQKSAEKQTQSEC